MRAFSQPSAPAVLLKIRRSRWLAAWWRALHGFAALALLMTNPWLGAAALPLLAWHAARRRPVSPGLILVAGRRFDLPEAGRFGLSPAAGTRIGHLVIELVFSDCPGGRVLILRDQLEAAEWRHLRLALAESA